MNYIFFDYKTLKLDLVHRDIVLDSKLDVIDKFHISGHRFSSSWAEDQRLFYDIEFSRPYADVIIENNSPSGKSVKAAFIFDSSESNELEVRVGISAVDQTGALQNRKHELDGKTFEDVLPIVSKTVQLGVRLSSKIFFCFWGYFFD